LLGRNSACAGSPAIAKLYDLVRSRASATPYLEGAERIEKEYADLAKRTCVWCVTALSMGRLTESVERRAKG
jgi:hypothetical protein